MTTPPTKRRRKWKIALVVLCGLAVVWLAGDFVYSRVILRRIDQWESSVERNGDGIQTGCEAFTAGQGNTAIVFVHGFNDSPRCWSKMAPRIASDGFTCRAVRLPGFGETVANLQLATREKWLATVQQEVSSLRQEHQRLFLVAHSLGGAITIAYLLEQPDAVDGVVLIAPAVEVSNDRSPLLPTRAWHELGNVMLPFTRITQTPFSIDASDPAERDYPGRLTFSPKSVVDETFALVDINRGRAGEFKTPLLMVIAKKDVVVDWRAAQQFYEEASSPRKAIVYADQAGHAIPVDYGWEKVAQHVVKFVNESANSEQPAAAGSNLLQGAVDSRK